MNRTLFRLALLAALIAPAAWAQGQDQYDAFGIVDDGASLDQLVPDDGSPAPAPPRLEENEPEQAAPAPVTTAPTTVAPAAPAPAATGPEAVPQVAPPAGWKQITFQNVTAWVPEDFEEIENSSDTVMYSRSDEQRTHSLSFGLLTESDDGSIPPGAEVSVDKLVSIDGQTLRWRELSASLDDTHTLQAIIVQSQNPIENDIYLFFMAGTMNLPLEENRALIQTMLGTIRFGEAPVATGEALDGLVSYQVPQDWHVINGPDGNQIGLWPAIYSGYISIARGAQVTGEGGTDAGVPPGTPAIPAEIFGQPADLFSWASTEPEFQVAASMKPGRKDFYRLRGCVNGDAVSVMIAGVSDFIDGTDLGAVLGGFTLNIPGGLEPCPGTAAPSGNGAAAAPAIAPEPPVAVAPDPGDAGAVFRPPVAVAPAGVRAVTAFQAPAGWQAFAFHGYTGYLAPGYQPAQQTESEQMFFKDDVANVQSTAFGMTVQDGPAQMPPDAVVSVERDVTLDGQPFVWRELTADPGNGARSEIILLASKQPLGDAGYLLIYGMGLGKPLADNRAEIEEMLGTVRLGAVAARAPQTGAAIAGTAVDVQGVSYILPQGWSAQYDSPGDKRFVSPDGRLTLLSFWWFPDEPLLGYDDISAVENIVIDHEPVTRIHSEIGTTRTIQNVTERARGDKNRFIFTVEGDGVSAVELQAIHDRLIANLHLQGGFDPAKRVDPMAGAAPAPAPAPAQAPAPSRSTGETGGEVRFANGIQGWTGKNATLTARPDGGPDGAGVLEAFTPGDGLNGYLVAPARLHGNWTGFGALRLTVKTVSGTYFGGFDDDDHGDIYLVSGTKTAAIAFPTEVGTDWTVEDVRFDDAGWRLGGGARSVAEVLANVTDFQIRIEYLLGDATAWISRIEFFRRGTAATPAVPSAGGDGWATYVNPRFGTRIDYPAALFHALPPPENGDGLTFETADGRARLLVFGQANYDGLGARAMMTRDRDWGGYDQITYQTSGNGWYVLSGYVGTDIFYRKAVIDAAAGVVHVFEISYPRSARDQFDPVVTRLARSFGHQ